jgi:hypothetical protein
MHKEKENTRQKKPKKLEEKEIMHQKNRWKKYKCAEGKKEKGNAFVTQVTSLMPKTVLGLGKVLVHSLAALQMLLAR